MEEFDSKVAFMRNIGLLTEEEQKRLKEFTIAIPGMGGVGGLHLISLVREGFEKFKIADLDKFELKNFNRQYGAVLDTIGKSKVDVMKQEALKINPNCKIEVFDKGINKRNIMDFLKNVDLAVDGLDFFGVNPRRMFFNESVKMKIPLITAGPIGFGTSFLIFMPGSPNFDKFFNINNKSSYEQKLASFAVGLAPKLLHTKYVIKGSVSFKEKRGPSSIGAVNLCSGIVAVYALKILLKKGKVNAVPHYHHFDPYLEKYIVGRLWLGNKGIIQRLKIFFGLRMLKKLEK